MSSNTIQAVEGVEFQYVVHARDVDSETLVYSYRNLPEWLTVQQDSIIIGTPIKGVVEWQFTAIVDDGEATDSLVIHIDIEGVNDPPVWQSSELAVAIEDEIFSYQPLAIDPENGTIIYSILALPNWLTFQDSVITGTPIEGIQDTSMVLVASDGLLSDTLEVTIRVIPINDAPEIIHLHDITFENTFVYSINLDTCVVDPDQDIETLEWSISCLEPGVSILLTNRAVFLTALTWSGSTELSFKVTDSQGAYDSLTVALTVTGESGVKQAQGMPASFELSRNYPNPFNPVTTIPFAVPHQTKLTINIFNARGEQVETLLSHDVAAGYHILNWDASNNAAGLYFIQMKAPGFIKIQKCLLIK